MGGALKDLQYLLAAALIWGAVAYGLWDGAHPARARTQIVLACGST